MSKPKVAFICVHNSCRSQIAEALGKHLASDVFESYSAGTEVKLLADIPQVDIVVTMGCNVACPFLPCKHREDWGLNDPSGKNDTAFEQTIQTIEYKILDLAQRIQNGI